MKFLRWSNRTRKVTEAKKISTINDPRKIRSSGLVRAPATLNSAWKPKAGVTMWTGNNIRPNLSPHLLTLRSKYPVTIESAPIANRWTCVRSWVMIGNAR